MNKINWKVRFKKKSFWLALIPALLLVAQAVADVFGYSVPVEVISTKAINIVNSVFALLVIMGIVNDPTTRGVNDSDLAMNYSKPQ